MGDDVLLLVQLLPLTRRGEAGGTVEGWGAYLTGPESPERLRRGVRRNDLTDGVCHWSGLVWHSEADIVEDLQDAGWTAVERRLRTDGVVLVMSQPAADEAL